MSTSRSPSPVQRPPTPSAPGPRASALQKLHSDAITHILKTCSYTNFASCFPTPASAVPGSLKLLHEQFTTKLGDSMRKEFQSILDERNVVQSLNELDRLIEDARKRRTTAAAAVVPPHTLPARQLYVSHLAPKLKVYEEEIGGRMEGLERENEMLSERVGRQREEIKMLVEGLEGVVRDLEGSVSRLGAEDVEGLMEGNREVDEGMR